VGLQQRDPSRWDQGAAPLTTEVERREGATVVHASGEVDLSNADRLATVIARSELESTGPLTVVDLRDVTFFDAAGIGVLVTARERHPDSASLRVVVTADGLVRRLLDVAGLDDHLHVHTSLEDALRT
jgi:anti-sigma B factor antagonist